MPVIVRDSDDDTAIIFMVDSNIQRENILPSEKAKAYQMKMDAIRRKAGRPPKDVEITTDENGGQVGHHFRGVKSRDLLAENSDDSARTIQRYAGGFSGYGIQLDRQLHIQSVDQISAIKTVKRKITDLDRAKIEEQKKAVRAGYDMDIIPSDLATYGTEEELAKQRTELENLDIIGLVRSMGLDPDQLAALIHAAQPGVPVREGDSSHENV